MSVSAMRVGAAPRVAVARTQTVKVVARGSWRESATITAQPAGRTSANRVSPTRSVLPTNWRQELESLRNGNGNGSSAAAAPAPAPARSSSASWRTEGAAPARPTSAPKKAVTPTRSSLPANWKQELESLRGGASSSPSAAAAPPARPSSSPMKAVTPTRSALPANWKQELESLRSGGSSPSAAGPTPAHSSASWRTDAPAAAPARPSSAPKKTVTPTRSALPANWKQELESLRGGAPSSPSSAAPAPAPARSSSANWRTETAPAAAGADKVGTNPWTGKAKIEIKRTTLPSDWRKGA